MKWRIDELGRLELIYTNSTEKYAIERWIELQDLSNIQVIIKEEKDVNKVGFQISDKSKDDRIKTIPE